MAKKFTPIDIGIRVGVCAQGALPSAALRNAKTQAARRYRDPELLHYNTTLFKQSGPRSPFLASWVCHAWFTVREDTLVASLVDALEEALTAVKYYHQHEGAPVTLDVVRAAIKSATASR